MLHLFKITYYMAPWLGDYYGGGGEEEGLEEHHSGGWQDGVDNVPDIYCDGRDCNDSKCDPRFYDCPTEDSSYETEGEERLWGPWSLRRHIKS